MATRQRIRRSITQFVPDCLKNERAIVLRTYPLARIYYAMLRLTDSLGLRNHPNVSIPPHAKHFLFVCYGNIMRSPVAEALFRKCAEEQHLPIKARSAGLHAINGTTADPRAQRSAADFGISLANHRAQVLTSEMTELADIICVMDLQNQAELRVRFPSSRKKIRMLASFAHERSLSEIPDPYFDDATGMKRCCIVLASCVLKLIGEITETRSRDVRQLKPPA